MAGIITHDVDPFELGEFDQRPEAELAWIRQREAEERHGACFICVRPLPTGGARYYFERLTERAS